MFYVSCFYKSQMEFSRVQIRSCFYTSDEMSQEFYSTFGNAVVNHLPQLD